MAYSPKFCANPSCIFHQQSGGTFHKKGFFKIRRLHQSIRRFQCVSCKRTFSSRSFKADYRHKKMDLNFPLADLLIKGNTLRDCAHFLGLTYRNTYKKFLWITKQAQLQKTALRYEVTTLQFDEMETIHHTKCKPLSICVMVNDRYEVLSAEVAEMPSKGRLASFSKNRYGSRKDEREVVMERSFQDLKNKLHVSPILVRSDAKSSYKKFVEKYFPEADYEVHSREQKARLQERLHEKKHKKKFDPLFALNQRCAKLRSQIKRLTRRSWCTTKKKENLQGHLDLYIVMQYKRDFLRA